MAHLPCVRMGADLQLQAPNTWVSCNKTCLGSVDRYAALSIPPLDRIAQCFSPNNLKRLCHSCQRLSLEKGLPVPTPSSFNPVLLCEVDGVQFTNDSRLPLSLLLMGQLLSRQVTPARPQLNRSRNVPQSQHSRHERSSEVHVDDSRAAPKASHRNDRFPSRAQHTTSALGSKARLHSLREVDGNVGAPRRQQKYVRGKASKDHSYRSVCKSDNPQPSDKPRDAKSQKVHVNVSKSGSHNTKSRVTKECIVCTDNRSVHHFPNRAPTEHCDHDANICRRCLRIWIQSEFSTKIWNEINCPMCAARMQYNDIHDFAPKEVFRR
jgi:hypothetical protein